MCGSTLMPATLQATTKGEALALVDCLLAARSSGESAGTINPDDELLTSSMGDQLTDEENRAAVKEDDTVKASAHGSSHVLAGVLHLAQSDADHLCAGVRVHSRDECRHKPEEAPEVSLFDVLLEREITPGLRSARLYSHANGEAHSETPSIVGRPAPKVDDESHDHEAGEDDDFESGAPELSVSPYTERLYQ